MKTKPWNETIVIGDFSYADREIDNLICQVSRPVQNDWGFRKFLSCLRSEDILSSVDWAPVTAAAGRSFIQKHPVNSSDSETRSLTRTMMLRRWLLPRLGVWTIE